MNIPGRQIIQAIGLAGLLAATLAACSQPSPAGATLSIDGEDGPWSILTGPSEDGTADARFNPHGVATAVELRARNGDRLVEVYSTFLGGASEPVFLQQKVSYRDASGTIFERTGSRAGDDSDSGIRWDRLELDRQDGTGYGAVTLDVPVCVDHYTGPLEYETRCHQVKGELRASLDHDPQLRVQP